MPVDIERFSTSEDSFAAKFARDDLPGLLSKRLHVPEGTLALVKDDAGEARVLEAGAETGDVVSGLLVRDRLSFELTVEAGRSEDGHPFTVGLGLELKTRRSAIDLGQLEQELLVDGRATRGAVVEYFLPFVRDAVRFFVSERQADALVARDQRSDLDTHLQQQLNKPLFETGLELIDVLHPTFSSPSFEERRTAAAEASARAEALERERELQQLKRQLDMDALLGEIEVRDEADRARRERRLARFEELRARMGDDDRKALIMMLDDDKQRATLIRELIAQDMSPEQRAKLELSDMEARVEERLGELQQKLAHLTGAGLAAGGADPITRRVLAVVGKRVLAFDPKTNLHPEVPKEVYDTEEGGLGYLRSVRSERIDGEDWLLVGAQRGAYRINGQVRHEYRFPDDPQGKGGVNAVAYFDGRVYATHSEVGLVEWSLDGSGARRLCEEELRGAGSVRGAVVVGGRLFFSAGAEVLAVDLATGNERPVRYRGADDSITAFTVTEDEVVAGSRGGKTYRWHHDDPGSPEAMGVLKQNPIFMLRHARIAGQRYYVIGSKDFTVTAAEPRKDLFREYQAREEVRWVDAAGDFVFGVSRSGYKLFCWEVLRQIEPKLTIRVSDKVQDLFVVEMDPPRA